MMLECDWGRGVATEDDSQPCPWQATNRVAIHDGPDERMFHVCEKHYVRLLRETDPHA